MGLARQEGHWETFLTAPLGASETAFTWLGQAGFAFRHGARRWMIDPYLSDHLAVKYRDTTFPHTRMMDSPVAPEQTPPLDAILCSHRHSDHMDPVSLPLLAQRSPKALIIVPRAERDHALALGLPEERLVLADAGERVELFPELSLLPIPSSHETMETDPNGNHRFLGFIFTCGGVTFYHGGDTVPYEGLSERLREHGVSVALVPVNGRDAYRREHGVPGNMNLEEAAALCAAADVPWLVPHHFGMFDFNTMDETLLRNAAADMRTPRCLPPDTEHFFVAARETTETNR